MLPSHTGHRPEGRHGRPCRRWSPGSVSTAAERLASKSLTVRAGRFAARRVWGPIPSTWRISTRSRAGLRIAISIERLADVGLDLWLDAGVRDRHGLGAGLLDLGTGRDTLVVGLESVTGRRSWRTSSGGSDADRAIFSLDLDAGTPRIAPRSALDGATSRSRSPPRPSIAVSAASSCSTWRGWVRAAGSGPTNCWSGFGSLSRDRHQRGRRNPRVLSDIRKLRESSVHRPCSSARRSTTGGSAGGRSERLLETIETSEDPTVRTLSIARHSTSADWPKLSSTSTRSTRGMLQPRALIASPQSAGDVVGEQFGRRVGDRHQGAFVAREAPVAIAIRHADVRSVLM